MKCAVRTKEDIIEAGRAEAGAAVVHGQGTGHCCMGDKQTVFLLLPVGR